MSKSIFSAPHFNDEAAAYAFVEAKLWPDGAVCPHCGVIGQAGRLQGKSNRPGLWKCYACRKPFSVKVGTIFEASHIQMRDWLCAIHLICSSKKGISANQLSRTLGITLKSAWFLGHRIREAMGPGSNLSPLGGEGEIVEADETYIGRKAGAKPRKGAGHKMAVLALVERKGRVRSFTLNARNKKEIQGRIHANVDRKTHLMTDEAPHYLLDLGMKHSSVHHASGEYVRGDVTTNTVEGVFSVFKRGMIGTYQHCEEQHLQRYLNEFDFRYSNRVRLGIDDDGRAANAIKGAAGKRLTYRRTSGQQAGA